jgi:hypothetical protein
MVVAFHVRYNHSEPDQRGDVNAMLEYIITIQAIN